MPGDQSSTVRHEVPLPRLGTDLRAHNTAAEDSHQTQPPPLQGHESERSIPACVASQDCSDGPAGEDEAHTDDHTAALDATPETRGCAGQCDPSTKPPEDEPNKLIANRKVSNCLCQAHSTTSET